MGKNKDGVVFGKTLIVPRTVQRPELILADGKIHRF
jgi:hypothetical protein